MTFDDPDFPRWLVEVRTALDDMDAVMKDRLRKKRKRALGHERHHAMYKGARRSMDSLLAYAEGRKAAPTDAAPLH
jgi:hypothetical protein